MMAATAVDKRLSLSAEDLADITEFLSIVTCYLRRLGSQDALQVRQSNALSARLMGYAERSEALRIKIGGLL